MATFGRSEMIPSPPRIVQRPRQRRLEAYRGLVICVYIYKAWDYLSPALSLSKGRYATE
jgi:hypothetical protein